MNYEEILKELIEKDDKYFVLTAENRASLRTIPPQIENNFLDVGIAEMNLIGISAGLALRGRVPIAHALAAFLTMRAYEFIRTDIAYPNLPAKLVGSFAGILSTANGPAHQGIEDIALMSNLPNMNVFAPADEEDMLLGIKQILESDMPFYIRYTDRKNVYSHSKDFQIGKAEVIGKGNEIVIITYSNLFSESFRAYEILSSMDLDVKLLNLRTVKPLDEDTIKRELTNAKLLVLVEDTLHFGGIYHKLIEIIHQNKINIEILPINFKSKFFIPSSIENILEYEGLTAEAISERILLKYKSLGE